VWPEGVGTEREIQQHKASWAMNVERERRWVYIGDTAVRLTTLEEVSDAKVYMHVSPTLEQRRVLSER
jgi:hypothetical protein